MNQAKRKNESSQTFSSTGYESFSMTPSTSTQNKRDLLYLFKKLNVNQKYVDIQLARNFQYDEIEKLTEEEFAQKFQANNTEEYEELSEIYMRLKSETLPESCEMQRVISISNSSNGEDDDDDDDNYNYHHSNSQNNHLKISSNKIYHSRNQSQTKQSYQQNSFLEETQNNQNQNQYKNNQNNNFNTNNNMNYKLASFNNFENFATHSQYQYASQNLKDQNLTIPQFVTNLSQTVFYNSKQLPYNPFDFETFTYISQSVSVIPEVNNHHNKQSQQIQQNYKIQPSEILSVTQQLKQISLSTNFKNNLEGNQIKQNSLKQHIYLKVIEKYPNKTQNHILHQNESLNIGRHSSCQINILSDEISRYHATISAKNNKYYIQDNGSNLGTFLQLKNDQQYILKPTSIFMCGLTQFKVCKIILEEDQAQISLKIIGGLKDNLIMDFNLILKPSKACFIGSHIQCDIKPIDKQIERYHASLIFKKGQLQLMDLSSQTGTWIRLSEPKQSSEQFEILDSQTILINPFQIKAYYFNS